MKRVHKLRMSANAFANATGLSRMNNKKQLKQSKLRHNVELRSTNSVRTLLHIT